MEDGAWFLLLLAAGTSAGFLLLAIATPGWRRLPLLWAAATATSWAVFVVALEAEVSSDWTMLGLSVGACAVLARVVTRWAVVPRSPRVGSFASALCASTLGAFTPLVAVYLLLYWSAGGGGTID